MAARKAYFKAISQEQIDADQASALLSLGSRVAAVETGKADAAALATKAEVSYVDSAVGTVDAKVDLKLDASQASNYATASQLLQKADIAYVEGQINSIAAVKADASVVQSLSSDVSSHTNQLVGLNQQVQNKQDASQASQRVAAENAWIGAVKEAIFIESAPGSAAEFDYTTLGL
jgi:hypothetical protein